jgi:signal transduction histidine kinase
VTVVVRSLRWSVRGFVDVCWRLAHWLLGLAAAGVKLLYHPELWKRSLRSFFNRLRNRRTSLRRWLLIALVALFAIPALTTGITGLVWHSSSSSDSNAVPIEEILDSGADRWREPAWQREIRAELKARSVDVVLYEDGTEVYRTSNAPIPGPPVPESPAKPDDVREYAEYVVSTEPVERKAVIYGDPLDGFGDEGGEDPWPIPLVFIGALIATFIGIAIFFGRMVVKPLAATSVAAGEVAGGNLAISLPGSRIREVAEVNAAFEGMASSLSESLAQEADLERERKLFIGAIAHDLRTPLFSLRGSLEAIETGVADSPEKQRQYLEMAREKADTLDRLISDLFDFTRLEYLDQEPQREPLEIGALVRRAVEGVQAQATGKAIALTVEDHSGNCVVLGDAHMLTRAIDNLLDNAIRYSPAGGSARVECLRDGQGVVISVSDNGPGVPPEDLPHIFSPLYRAEDSRNRRTGGAGLGLTIARNVFLAHGGDLTARNGPNGGAVFVGTLPCRDN